MINYFETSKQRGYHNKIDDFYTKNSEFTLTINTKIKHQKVIGFGGAFTEAAALTFSKLSAKNQESIIEAYFDRHKGLRYNLGRVAIHSCDFALENYTYIDEYDMDLITFSIDRDYRWVIPMIKQAEEKRGKPLSILASPWSPPAWMKSNNSMNHGGELLPKYFQVWADYYVKFIDAYAKAGIDVFAITVQNEPAAKQVWDSCLYSAEQERDFIKYYLGPTLLQSEYCDTKIIIWDHNRDIVYERAHTVLCDKETARYVWGTGIHWYVSEAFENLSKVHEAFPDKHILFTEGCIEGGVRLNDFKSGERYARNMIGDFSHYCEGYIDWNLMLDETGGPNHVGNYCDAPIIADTQNDKVYFNSSYYAIGHFSKYIDEGAHRIESQSDHPFVKSVVFENPNGEIIVVLQNETEEDSDLNLQLRDHHTTIKITKRSIITLTIAG